MNIGAITAPSKGSATEWTSFHHVTPTLAVSRLPESWIGEFVAVTTSRLGSDTASEEILRRVQSHNPDSIWGIFSRDDSGEHRLAGHYSFLLLNAAGHKALLDHALDTKRPQPVFLVEAGERPAAIYIWGVVAEKLTRSAGPEIARQMAYLHSALPVYAIVVTEAGLRRAREAGYKPVTTEDDRLGGMFLFDGFLPKTAAAEPTVPHIRVIAVSKVDELAQAMAIRATVFMGEQHCPYAEEFDDNDFCATHLLGFVGEEPVATMRLRYFADWVKFERMAVLDRFRSTTVKDAIVNYAFEIARRKGYRQCYGHSQKRLIEFWQQFGFELFPRNSEFHFSDHEYVEIWRKLEPHPTPLTMHSNPMVMIRPEGRWDQPGILEKSAVRPATNPH
ncbi:MAG: N-acetyltransferase [Rhizomicrobium sp.]|jgi:predicted GNAT family N-acyltransferase